MVEAVIANQLELIVQSLYFASILFLLGIGLSLIFGTLNFLNLAHASFLSLGAFMTATLVTAFVPTTGFASGLVAFAILLVVVPVLTAVVGLALDFTLFRPTYDMDVIFQLLATFGLVLMFEGLMLFIWGGNPRSADAPAEMLGSVAMGRVTIPLYLLFVFAVTTVIAVALYYFFEDTRLGRITLAMAEDIETVNTCGINTRSIHLQVLLLGIGLAGLSGALWLPNASVTTGLSLDFVILAFAIIVIGGLGSLKGAIAASLLAGFVRTYGIVLVPELSIAIIYLLMAVVVLIKPTGIYGGIEA